MKKLSQAELDEKTERLCPEGYYFAQLQDGPLQIKKSKKLMEEAVIKRKIHEADFNRRMNLPDPVMPSAIGWWPTAFLLMLWITTFLLINK